jgi:hypothetical protein
VGEAVVLADLEAVLSVAAAPEAATKLARAQQSFAARGSSFRNGKLTFSLGKVQ